MATHDAIAETDDSRHSAARVFWGAVVIALAHLAVVVVRPSPAVAELAVFELLILGVVGGVVTLDRRRDWIRHLAVSSGLFVTLVGGTWLLVERVALHWAVILSGIALTILSYGLHRWQLVTLGLVEVTDEQ